MVKAESEKLVFIHKNCSIHFYKLGRQFKVRKNPKDLRETSVRKM